jgi:uncharacterized YccA/Bax inhibitor family protein
MANGDWARAAAAMKTATVTAAAERKIGSFICGSKSDCTALQPALPLRDNLPMAFFKSSNPAFRSSVYGSQGMHAAYGEAMTVEGTIHRTGILLICAMATALYTWSRYFATRDPADVGLLVLAGAFGGFIMAMVTCFKMEWAPVTAPIYALLEGLFLGGVSAILDARYPGIANQSVGLTFGTCFCMLAAYRSGLLRATPKFVVGVVAATGGICLMYFLSMLLGFLGIGVPGIFGAGPVGILFSLVVVVIAALNLILDFNFIEQGAEMGAPKYMEWYGAFGLMVTLVWLYMEILRLLSKLRGRR